MKIKTDQTIMNDRSSVTQKITDFWNRTSVGWRTIWGPHIHHGYYEEQASCSPVIAQEKLIVKLVEFLEMPQNNKILDVGCGMGGSSLYLAKNYHSEVMGITLSKTQMAIANNEAELADIKNVSFKIEDALSLSSIPDNYFDIVWSLESCEQFYDKQIFLKQAFRVLKPGGKLMLATWCSDQEEYTYKDAQKYRKLCLAFDLPYMPTIERYNSYLEAQEFKVNKIADWTKQVEKSWEIGLDLLGAYNLYQLFKLAGWRGIRMAYQVKLMRNAYREKRIKYGVFLATKN